MGTRSLTTFIEPWTDKANKPRKTKIVTMYKQYDGYPEEFGTELAEFLNKGTMVNSIGMTNEALVFNGMGCLAAQVVANFKDGPGGIYLHRGGTTGCWEDYRYEIIGNGEGKDVTFKCYQNYGKKPKLLFSGSPKDFPAFAEEFSKKESAE